MDPLEGTTLELIHRRRVTTFYPGYTIILIVVGIIVALPLVKVDVISTSGGMIRPGTEPVELFSSITGIVDSTLLFDHRDVSTGDTLLWLRKNMPETRMKELQQQIQRNTLYFNDIECIIKGKEALLTTRYRQSYRMFTSSGKQLILQKSFLQDEFTAAGILFDQKVIPRREFEHSRSEYLVACAQLEDHQERYLNQLEDEMNRLHMETLSLEGELEEIRTSLQNYHIVAPSSGRLCQCRGILTGSVIQPGSSLACISPGGFLVADCYVETRDIKEIQEGTRVRIRMDGKSQRKVDFLETRVSQIDPDIRLINGRPIYRVRCNIESAQGLIPGMTFSASMLLYRASLASLLTEKLNRHFNPTLAQKQKSLN
ncbi:MAG: HlyD family efflux transporter periplasmic adaptor subunit [Bacteroides sp.]|nr:HlyD family efflux transporter periplasmic adaptor subunit [Bacteroides sp.]